MGHIKVSAAGKTYRGTAGNDTFRITAADLPDSQFLGGRGNDTLKLLGGGSFFLNEAVLSSIETIRGSSAADTIAIDAAGFAETKALIGGGGADVLRFFGSGTYDLRNKSISGFTRIEVDAKRFEGIFTSKALAMLVDAKISQNDKLTLVGGTFTEAERLQLHRQGVDTIIDDSGAYSNVAPRIHNLTGERVYTSGGQVHLDRGLDATVGGLDDKLASLEVVLEDEEGRTSQVLIVEDSHITLSNGMAEGSQVRFDGVVIGTLGPSQNGGVRVALDPNAPADGVAALIHALVFENTDPDPSIRPIFVNVLLTDEGGRTEKTYGEVWAGGPAVKFLDLGQDNLSGGTGNDLFATDTNGLSAGDALDGDTGTDTLYLFGGGAFDIRQFGSLSGIEIVRGSSEADIISIDESQLSGIATIDGGAEGTTSSTNTLNLYGSGLFLSGKTIQNFSSIVLREDDSIVTLDSKALALQISASLVSGAALVLEGNQSLSDAEIGTLFRHGFTEISFDGQTITNQAPELEALDANTSSGIAGTAIFLDEQRDARVFDDDQAFSALRVRVTDGAATEHLGIAGTDRVQLISIGGGSLRVYVDGINIGYLASPQEGAPELLVQFNERSRPDLVQAVIRALTYTDTTGTLTTPRTVEIHLTDYTGHGVDAVVTVEQEANQAPTDLVLDETTVAENAQNGTVVGVLAATDANAGDAFTFELLDDAGGRFKLVGNTLVVKQGALLDFEQAETHTVKVMVTDKAGASLEKSFTVVVSDSRGEQAAGSNEADLIWGGIGDDRLSGGLGSDTLVGGADHDTFVFDTTASRTNVDRIMDFDVAEDTIGLSKAVFTKLGAAGALAATAFWKGAKAHDRDDRIMYDSKSGALFYDADGSGRGAAVKIAILAKNLKLTAEDFLVI